jgi:hypothetical protein
VTLSRMIAPLRGVLLAMCLVACATNPQVAAPSGVTLATPEEATAAITARDEYLAAVTAADVSIWLHQPGSSADLDALARHFAASLRPWDADERARLAAMIERVSPRVALVAHLLPHGVQIAAIDASATAGADFTRGHTIFLSGLKPTDAALDERFFHELFHVISRAHPGRRDALYGIIGFERCTPLVLDSALRARVLTNPDAPVVEYVSRLEIDGRTVLATPLMIADLERYTTTSGLFDHVATQFTPFIRDQQGRCTRDENATVTQPQIGRALLARAGNNTNYAIHPEELVADNFAQMMMGRSDAPSPQIYDQIAEVLGITRPPAR